jgi:putative ABC transport system permease protein
MFDLKRAIKEWRKKTQAEGRLDDGQAEELECHLTDHIDDLLRSGNTPEQAFKIATKEIGTANEIGDELHLARERRVYQVTRTFLPALVLNYLKIMARQFNKHRMHNWVTVCGLAVGLTACLFIAFYCLHELSYDKQYANTQIYRVAYESVSSTGVYSKDAGGPIPLGPALKEEFPEVREAVRFWSAHMPVVRYNDEIFQEHKFMFVDPAALNVFRFPLAAGESSSAFTTANSVVISETMAKKYFRGDDPIGKVLEYRGYPGDAISFTVAGVFKDLPGNTHFSFDFLASFKSIENWGEINWGSFKPIWTYVLLDNDNAAITMQQKLGAFADKYVKERRDENKSFEFLLEPVSSIHLESNAGRSMKPGGNLAMIRIAVLTGILVLVMSCVNFVNISLAKMTTRMKEVGMRKVLGAVRRQLIFQFITEIAVSFIVALLIASGLIFSLSPSFEAITGIHVTLQSVFNVPFMFVLAGVFVLVVLLSGYLPAKTVTGLNIVDAFRQRIENGGRNFLGRRNALILLQVMISGMLILSVLIIRDQLAFIARKDIGIKIHNVVAIPTSENPTAYENKLRSIPGVESFGYSQRLPVNTLNYDGRIVNIPGIEKAVQVESSFITPEFLDTYRIEFLAGRNFISNQLADSNKFIINETAMKTFGWTVNNAIGQPLTWSQSMRGEVIGVVKDFHLESVHTTIPPMVMLHTTNPGSSWRQFISIRLHPENETDARKEIERSWRELNLNGVFSMVTMTESLDQLHENDRMFSNIVFYFTVVAIFISVIGLYAVSSYTAEQRRKEIGIRKVLGSGVGSIAYKLAAPYLYITMASMVVIIPAVYLLMSRWLATFAYHTSISWLTIIVSLIVIIAMTLVSVIIESLRAALVNPIRFLRQE